METWCGVGIITMPGGLVAANMTGAVGLPAAIAADLCTAALWAARFWLLFLSTEAALLLAELLEPEDEPASPSSSEASSESSSSDPLELLDEGDPVAAVRDEPAVVAAVPAPSLGRLVRKADLMGFAYLMPTSRHLWYRQPKHCRTDK